VIGAEPHSEDDNLAVEMVFAIQLATQLGTVYVMPLATKVEIYIVAETAFALLMESARKRYFVFCRLAVRLPDLWMASPHRGKKLSKIA
jgi:hypothetical protein